MMSRPRLSDDTTPRVLSWSVRAWCSWLMILGLFSNLLPASTTIAPIVRAQQADPSHPAALVPTVPHALQPIHISTTATTQPCEFASNPTIYLPVILHGAGMMSGSMRPPANRIASDAASLPAGVSPDPLAVAPTLDRSVPTEFAASVQFLYTGSNPIQTGVDPATIDPLTVAVVRGCVRDQEGNSLPGVTVSVHGRPEFGSTLTGRDGQYNLAVNGGGTLTLVYQQAGKLPVQRTMQLPLRDYHWADPVALMALDPAATTLDLGAGGMQIAQGSIISDTDGVRQAALLVPQGTQAEMILPDGIAQPLASITIRATEYTVGEQGPASMPATLPPQSGYTYALEYSIDQAMAAGAADVHFSQLIYHYVENFLNFPTGISVPTGFYDAEKAAWVASESGRVVTIVAIADGLADLDTDGDGAGDNDPALGVTAAERAQLAARYQAGQSLWRVPLTHFSTWDMNWGIWPPAQAADAKDLGLSPAAEGQPTPKPCNQPGSIIECQNQTLGETADLVGTPFSLNYRSDYTPGRAVANQIRIPITPATPPAPLKRVDLEVLVAGQLFTQRFPADPNQEFLFSWDGRDGYGRAVQGTRQATVRLGYVYDGAYQQTDRFGASGDGTLISGDAARQELTLWSEWSVPIGTLDARGIGLGGWTLSEHQVYDQATHTLYQGNGRLRVVNPAAATVIERFAGAAGGYDTGDGGPALEAGLNGPHALAFGSDGSVYVSTIHRIRRIDAEGIITTVAGTGTYGFSGDGGPATQAQLHDPSGLAVGPDGSLYICDSGNNRIRRIGPDGIITTIAGQGEQANLGDGGPATQAALDSPGGLVVAPDGTIYVTIEGSLIRRIGPDGIITTVFSGASRNIPWLSRDLALDGSGGLYFQNGFGAQVFRLGPDGAVREVSESGGAGRQSGHFALGPNGQVYVSHVFGYGGRIYRVNTDTSLTPVVGNGGGPNGPTGDGGPPLAAQFNSLGSGFAIAPDGTIYITEYYVGQIRRVGPALPRYSGRSTFIPSEDGSALYVFDAFGRHQRTVHALTGATLLTFGYDSTGRLTGVTDGDGDVTTIEHDTNGNPAAIVAQDRRRTTLSVNADGFLSSITNPAGERTSFAYTAGGLLTSTTDPRGNTSAYTYDAGGRLTGATDRAGASKAIGRNGTSTVFSVTYTDALARTTTYGMNRGPDGEARTVTRPDGAKSHTSYLPDGVTQTLMPNGMGFTMVEAGDPRFGMMAPIVASETITTPGGLRFQSAFTRTVTLADPAQALSLTTQVDTATVNGRTFTSTYNAAQKTFTLTSPLGRSSQTTIDAQGRITRAATPGIDPVGYSYDARGRLTGIAQSSGADARSVTLSYNGAGFLASITDPLGRSTTFSYDAVGRVTQQIEPGNRVTSFTYDANGNLTSLTPPGRTAHTFNYTPTDLTTTYTAPDAGGGAATTSYTYNAAQQLTQVTQPGGYTIDLVYDSAGRVSTLTTARGATTYSYSPATGQLTGIVAPGNIGLNYSYDGGLLTGVSQSGPMAGQVGYTYDNDFRVAATSVNGGNSISFGYDSDGLLASAGALSLSRNAQNGLLAGSTLGNTTDSWSYNSFAEPMGYQSSIGATALYGVTYTRDKLGRIAQKVETVGGMTATYGYSYDEAGRLTGVTRNGAPIESYSYDANGNRLSATVNGVTANGSYDAQDRLLTYGGQSYSYTANGELLTRTQGGQTTSYSYDALGNLTAVTLPDATAISYLIDGQNRRVGKRVNGTLVQGFLYESQLRPVAELDGAGNIVSRFVYATGVNVPDYMIKGGVAYRIITDQVGSVRLVVNAASGAVAQRIDYDSFGNITQDTNPGFQPFGFAGGLYDRDTSLVRFGARDYDPLVGRWTARDPIGFAGGDANVYGYVGEDPINVLDPQGFFSWSSLGADISAALTPGNLVGSYTGGVAGALIGGAVGAAVGNLAGRTLGAAVGLAAGALLTGNPVGALIGGALGSIAGQRILTRLGALAGAFLGEQLGQAIGGAIGSNLEKQFGNPSSSPSGSPGRVDSCPAPQPTAPPELAPPPRPEDPPMPLDPNQFPFVG